MLIYLLDPSETYSDYTLHTTRLSSRLVSHSLLVLVEFNGYVMLYADIRFLYACLASRKAKK